MLVHDLKSEERWNPEHHVERVLGTVSGGDVTVACWEPGQVSPYHAHPDCTEIYFCYEGGGEMRTPERTVPIVPGSFVVHPPGELHEYVNGPKRTLLFRVRYGTGMASRKIANRGQAGWQQSAEDVAFFERHPELLSAEVR
jgi:quercetin dioxygenase-like cupin family protein